jgi:hypothetical protein
MIERHGSTVFEGKVGTVSLAEEVQMVREVRAAIGDRPLQLDANGGWTVPTAREALAPVAPFDISWFEEPVETYEEMADLRRHFPIAFSAHAIDLPKAVALRCPDAIVTNINEHGGIAAPATSSARVRRWASVSAFIRARPASPRPPTCTSPLRLNMSGRQPDAVPLVCRRRHRGRPLRAGKRRHAGPHRPRPWRHAGPQGTATLPRPLSGRRQPSQRPRGRLWFRVPQAVRNVRYPGPKAGGWFLTSDPQTQATTAPHGRTAAAAGRCHGECARSSEDQASVFEA